MGAINTEAIGVGTIDVDTISMGVIDVGLIGAWAISTGVISMKVPQSYALLESYFCKHSHHNPRPPLHHMFRLAGPLGYNLLPHFRFQKTRPCRHRPHRSQTLATVSLGCFRQSVRHRGLCTHLQPPHLFMLVLVM